MKKIIAAVVLILITAASIPFVGGLIMERTVRGVFQDLNAFYAATGAGYSLEIVNYERGYAASDIEWKIDLGPLKALYGIDEIVFQDHAEHGFTGVVSTTRLDKNPWYASFVDTKLQGRDPMRIATRYSFLGKIDSTVAMDAFSVTVDNEAIDVKPATLVVRTDRKLKHFVSSGTWQGLSAGDTITIGDTSLASDLEMLSTFVWDGDFSFSVDQINVKENEKASEIKAVKVNYTLDVNDDKTTMSGEAHITMDRFKAEDLTVDNASVRFASKGIDIKGYEAFMALYTQNVSELLNQMAALQDDPETAREVMGNQMAAMGFKMMAAYEKLLKAGLELRVSDLKVTLAQGDINGDVTLRLLQDMTFMQFAPIAGQPQLLLDIFYLKSDISLPAALVGENPKMLAPAFPGMKTGLFVKKGDRLVHAAETVGGKLMVNNEEVVLSR